MNEENMPHRHHDRHQPQQRQQEHLVTPDAQRALITDNFRVAKGLLACKRPREFAPVLSPRNGGTMWKKPPVQVPPTLRVPLSELHSFSPVPAHVASTCVDSEIGSNGASVMPARQRVDIDAFGGSASPTGILNDEFDEEVLREIDAICEQRSSAKMERPGLGGGCASSDRLALNCSEGFWVDGNGSEHWRTRPSEEERVDSPQDAARTDGSVPQTYFSFWQSLNDRQREAACSDISIPLMIVAGPGSGKTSTMVGRVLTLLKEGISPTNILAMTFTTAAAAEMRDRIAKVTGKAVAKELAISTFHSFCLHLCRSHADKLHRTSEFLIYGHGQQRRAVIEALRLFENEKGQTSGKCSGIENAESFKEKSKKWQKFVTKVKASCRTPEVCQKMGDEMGAAILRNYDNILRSCNALDYHDFISCSVKLLTDFPEVYKDCQNLWKAIVVDEFQDTSSMQYNLLRVLSSHHRVTIIGDEDQSIFSFNGADACGFDSFRRDFPGHTEVQLCQNYRSTRCIVEAASFLIRNNVKRCLQKEVVTENSPGCKITIKECYTEDAQCAFVVDKILEITSCGSVSECSFNNIAILYRRQVTGRAFQMSFRDRKIPFNNHGVAFYRKKVIKAIMAILRTTLPGCGDGPFRQAFKALFSGDKEEKKKIINYIEKICSVRNCNFISAACDIFGAKISGTFKRAQLTQGRKVLSALEMLSKLVCRERSISAVISAAVNLLPQRYLLEQRAVIDVDSGKYLNEDHDLRSVLQYLLDDVAEFLSTYFSKGEAGTVMDAEANGCRNILGSFLDHISLREAEHFRSRRSENENSVTLTTIHQSKGLEWDTVFIVKANESEIPLSHEFNGVTKEAGTTLEEERRLLYVAMTRARKKLYILFVLLDANSQLLQPSRFLKEIPVHLIENEVNEEYFPEVHKKQLEGAVKPAGDLSNCEPLFEMVHDHSIFVRDTEDISGNSTELVEACLGNNFLKRFNVEDRSSVSHLFHQWAKKQAFQVPRRLIDKVGFVIDERLRNKSSKNKDLLRLLKASLGDDEAFQYAQYVLRWENISPEKRAHLTRQKQEHFQKQRIENSMSSSEATAKQVNYLQSLGCTIVPSSRLHASRLIEKYKSL